MSWLQKQVSEHPEKLFVQSGDKEFSYRDIDDLVQLYTRSLIRENLKKNDKVLILLESDIELVEVILSCFEVGVIAVPISTNLTLPEYNIIVKQIQPNIIITSWKFKSYVNELKFPNIFIEELIYSSSGCATINNKYIHRENDVAAIVLTSGTTGLPKPVQLTYGNFITSCSNWNEFLEFNNQDKFLCCLPLHHIGGLAVLIRGLIYGFSIDLIKNFSANKILNTISSHNISIISLVPTMLKRILNIRESIDTMKTLRWILLGGGPSPLKLLDYCIEQKLNIVKVYGMSETCSGTVGLKLLDEPENKLYAGRPFPNTKIWTVNKEIHISGPMVMKGYLGLKETCGVHNSKDLGEVGNDNLVFLNIRRKDLIISGGENINPMEVEEVLISIDNIIDAAVVGEDDDEWGQKVVAYIVTGSASINDEEIKNILKETLSLFKLPKVFKRVNSIPRNELGKIVYSKLI